MTCPVCGTVTVPGARYCHNCGAALPAAAPTLAERRVVTVLFGDLSDFTAWAEDLDPERVGAVTDRVLAALAGAVKTFGGHVDKLTGDGIMAVFGAPVAHEDDPERAVRAALSMQQAVRRVLDDERGGGAPLGLRVGLNTGEVVAGVQAALEYTVVGDTVNTAARLADAAAVGAVYGGSGTATATRRVASWRSLRPMRLKGKRAPVDTYELLGLIDAPGTRSGLGDEAPLVGRETELARVTSRLAEVADRREPRVMVVTAEAGIGKTRFAGAVARLAAGYQGSTVGAPVTGARVLSVRSAAYGERRRLGPLADLVWEATGLPPGTGGAPGRAVVEERLRRLVGRLGRDTVPAGTIEPLLNLLGYAEPARALSSQAQTRGAGQVGNGRRGGPDTDAIAAAVADLLCALAAEAPLVLIVDDLHDATGVAVRALATMLSRLSGPVLVVLLGRPEMVRGGTLTRLSDAEVVPLPPLRGADAARLLSSYLGGGRLPQADEDRLLATAQGNPFYLAELVTLLLERGALSSPTRQPVTPAAAHARAVDARAADARAADARAADARAADAQAVDARETTTRSAGAPATGTHGAATASASPAADRTWRLAPDSLGGRLLSRDLAAVLAARIDALPTEVRSVLRDAAVIGNEVPAGALEALRARRMERDGAGGAGAGPDARRVAIEVRAAVDELLHRRMLSRIHGGYAFATPLMCEAVYAGIGKADLAERHAHLARWAAAPAPDGDMMDDRTLALPRPQRDAFIAHHAERAVTLADSVGLRADAEPRDVAPLAVEALGRTARQALSDGEAAQALRQSERAAALAGDALPSRDRLVQARALLQLGRPAEALATAEKVAANAGEDRAGRAAALLVAGRAYLLLGDPDRAYSIWTEALGATTALPAQHAEAERRLGMADYLAGRLTEAESRFQASYDIAVAADDPRSQAWSLQNLAWVATTRGDFAGADTVLGRAARLFAAQHDPAGRAWLRGTTAFARILAGRLGEARRLARVFLPFGERVGEQWAVGTLRAVEAYAAAELGELAEADRQARRAYRDFAAASDNWGRGFALVVRGVIARGLGEPEHARDLLTDALGYGEQTGHPLLLGMAYTIRGFVDLERGDPVAAEKGARAALAVAEPLDVLEPAQVGPRTLLAGARLAQSDADTAVRLLEPDATTIGSPALLFARRQAVTMYAAALRVSGRNGEALHWARRAVELPAEDVRSRAVALRELARTLAACGEMVPARAAAAEAVAVAYGSEQASERGPGERLVAALG